MSFLSKLGSILLKGLSIVVGIAPLVSADPQAASVITETETILNKIITAVQYAEGMGQALSLPGAQKLIAAAPFVEQAVLDLFKARGWQIADETKFKADCAALTGVIADILNDVNGDAVKTIGL